MDYKVITMQSFMNDSTNNLFELYWVLSNPMSVDSVEQIYGTGTSALNLASRVCTECRRNNDILI